MFGIGPMELMAILVVALLVFGPKRIPELARTLGRGLAEFRRASNDLRQSLALDELQRDLRKDLDPNQTIHRPGDRPAQAGDDDELPKKYPNEHEHYAKQEAFEGRFWARMPLGESRFDVATRVHQAFGTFHRDNDDHGISNIIVVCHGVTLRAFTMMWLHRTPEWFEAEPNPKNCAVRLIEHGEDKGYVFPGFKKGQDP